MRLDRYLGLLFVAGVIVVTGCDKHVLSPELTFQLAPENPSLFIGGSLKLASVGSTSPSGVLKWSSTDTSVATVDGTGIVRGIAPGTATIRATAVDGYAETVITVVTGGSTLRTSAFTTCGIDTGTFLYCWGNNSRGQVGIGSSVSPQPNPVRLAGIAYSSVSVGWEHACAISQNVPYCWGLFTAWLIPEALGDVNAAAPYRVDPGVSVAQIEASGAQQESAASCSDQFCGSQTCVLTTGGDVACWGATGFSKSVLQPFPIINAPRFISISIGWDYGCGIATDHALYCWGGNGYEQSALPRSGATAVHRIGDDQFFQWVSAGRSHTCAIDVAGDAWCWGANSSRQLGAPSTETCAFRFVNVPCRSTPAKVEGGLKFLAIAVGTATPVTTEVQQLSHTCGLTTDLSIVCWGDNSYGELGNGTTQNSDVPVKVSSTLKFRSVTAGLGHTCGVTTNGDAFCWGRNVSGELGTGTVADASSPAAVTGGIKFK